MNQQPPLTAYIDDYLAQAHEIIDTIDRKKIADMINILVTARQAGGRLFILGVGGSAANASHAVNDFRKIAGIEAYSPTDNVSELTARINDEGWDSSFVGWLKTSRLEAKDCMLVLSVGGGNADKNISNNLVAALKYAQDRGVKILGIVGRDGGYTARVADAAVIIPVVSQHTVTPHSEAFQAVVWHLIVSHPLLKTGEMKWESVK